MEIEKVYKSSLNVSNYLFPLSETVLENGRDMEQLKSRQGLEDHHRFQIEWPQDLVRNTHKNPHITAKELQKRVENMFT